jgi:hypothetical protein
MLSVEGEDSRATNKVSAGTLRGYEVDTEVDMMRVLEDDVSRCLRKEIRGRTRYEALKARLQDGCGCFGLVDVFRNCIRYRWISCDWIMWTGTIKLAGYRCSGNEMILIN